MLYKDPNKRSNIKEVKKTLIQNKGKIFYFKSATKNKKYRDNFDLYFFLF